MFELIFLGTSSSAPSVQRGLSGHIIMHRQYRFLLDCGEGTQRQILHSGLGFKRLNKVLLTHSHLDHILGLGGLISTLARWENLENIDIYGGRATLKRVSDLLFKVVFPGGHTPLDINLITLEPGVIMEDDKFVLSAFPVSHRGPDCFGFVFEEKERRPFLDDQAAALGVPVGPERGLLVRGQTITLSDGRTIHPDDVLGETIPGVKYIHTGDVGRTDTLLEICRNADTLVIESTYVEEEAEMAQQFGHMTAARAATLARDAGVKSLILTHLSRRYFERDVRREAQAIFPNTAVARDFDHFQITRDGARRLPKTSSPEKEP
ncbi:MAG: ribonuclease Z [Chloroflexi bacterium]|jgi:ribonuclease Z|nr:ribonuclease Z [Chloroflexota bacterium]MBK6711268.1 ribonuclease Z [Chloroflexota bacterium]MBK7176270.1 ribonuclease Z [Chloroflexota bacterium]MBK7915851.1 ribonuclease Z [Chloroflexota bacterium]MBK8931168.1 ribonuclease Z [Chloroflexota bacterium]